MSTEPETPGRVSRVVQFLKEEAWLIAGCLVVVFMVRSGARDAETPEMREHRQQIEQLSQTDRDRLRHNHRQFRKLDPGARKELRALHASVTEDENLNRTLQSYHTWLASIPLERRESILKEEAPTARLELIRELRRPGHPGPGPTDAGPANAAPTRPGDFNALAFRAMKPLSPRDLDAVMQKLSRWVNAPPQPAQATPEGILKHHLSILDQVVFRLRNLQTNDVGPDGRRELFIPEGLRFQILSAISDPDIKAVTARRSQGSPLVLPALIGHSIVAIDVQRLMDHRAVDDDPLDRLYSRLPPRAREEFDAMTIEARKLRLRILWLESHDHDLAARLKKYTGRFQRKRPGQRPIRDRFEGNNSRGRPPGDERN